MSERGRFCSRHPHPISSPTATSIRSRGLEAEFGYHDGAGPAEGDVDAYPPGGQDRAVGVHRRVEVVDPAAPAGAARIHECAGRRVCSLEVLLVPTLADSLAGRMEVVRLHPLSQVELAHPAAPGDWREPPSGFLGALFDDGFGISAGGRLGLELAQRIVAGGYPAALARPAGRRRARWYANCLDAVVQRDARDLARIARLDVLPRLLEVAATQTGRLFNVSGLAAPFQLSLPTIRDAARADSGQV